MKASLAWLGQFVDLSDLSPLEVANRLTMVGLEVEETFDRFSFLEKVLVGKVIKAEDFGQNLKLCLVEAGDKGSFQILCGDPKIRIGQNYPLALPETELPSGPIKRKTILGQTSEGMLCSEAELGLGPDSSTLLVLSGELKPGSPLTDIYHQSDWIFEISITPNRADALSIMGLSRDLAAVLNRPLIKPKIELKEKDSVLPATDQIKVSIEDSQEGLRYVGRVINGVKVGPSPWWLAERLISLGHRPINNIVDVTNYVMLELGLPLHAFDLGKIAGPEIKVKVYPKGTSFVTLDGQIRILKAEKNILICDGQRPVAIGGIMGGRNSEVDENTKDIFLEGACFNSKTIRKTSKSLSLSTDASYRFERGQDPNFCPFAVDRAAALIAELSGGVLAQGRLDCYPQIIEPIEVSFSPSSCNALLGTSHPTAEMVRVLSAIEVNLSQDPLDKDLYRAKLPTFRPDLTREVDLYEEVVRLLDFENLPVSLPSPPQISKLPPEPFRLREKLRDLMTSLGFSEHLSYSFINPDFADKLSLSDDHPFRESLVPILNPLSEEHGVLRPSLIPGLISALRLNQYHGQWQVSLFETGSVFLDSPDEDKPIENQSVAAIMAGDQSSGLWCDQNRLVDFWDLKGNVEFLAKNIGLAFTFGNDPQLLPSFYNKAEASLIYMDKEIVGHMGLLSDKVVKAYGLKSTGGKVYIFELLTNGWPAENKTIFKPWSSYPGVTRDLAILLDRGVSANDVCLSIMKNSEWPLVDLSVFDLYEGQKLPEGKKSLALRLYFQDKERTLTDELVNSFFMAIVERVTKMFGAELRSS
jgi:phenylalanyl-tRNA synthetase beta chain